MKLVSVLGPISGSLGGFTAARNRGGTYLRARAVPTNPNSTRQQAVRAILGTLSSAWSRDLDDAARALWSAYAQNNPITDKLGQSITLSGMAWFCRLNSRLVDAGELALEAPPITSGPDALLSITPTWTEPDALSLAFTGTPAAESFLQVWQTLPGQPGSTPNKKQARLVGYSSAAPTTPEVFTLPMPGQTDQTAQFYVHVMDANGQLSAALHAEGVAIAAI